MIGEDEADPADKFMQRFAEHKPPVRKKSASKNVWTAGVMDKITGDQGLRLWVVGIKWVSDAEVQVEGGYYEGSESSSINTYTVKKENGKWKVTKDFLRRIA